MQISNVNSVTHFNVIQPFIKEIREISGLTLTQIALKCRISVRELYRLIENEVDTTSSPIFNKILCFYCAVCYNKNGQKIVLKVH